MAGGDAYISSDDSSYDKEISKHPKREEANIDCRMDFWEYMEANAPLELRNLSRNQVVLYAEEESVRLAEDLDTQLGIVKNLQESDILSPEEEKLKIKVLEAIINRLWRLDNKEKQETYDALVAILKSLKPRDKQLGSLIVNAILAGYAGEGFGNRESAILMLGEACKAIAPGEAALKRRMIQTILGELNDFNEENRFASRKVILTVYRTLGPEENPLKTGIIDVLIKNIGESGNSGYYHTSCELFVDICEQLHAENKEMKNAIIQRLLSLSDKFIYADSLAHVYVNLGEEDDASKKKILNIVIDKIENGPDYYREHYIATFCILYNKLSPSDRHRQKWIMRMIIGKLNKPDAGSYYYPISALLNIFEGSDITNRSLRAYIVDVLARHAARFEESNYAINNFYRLFQGTSRDEEHLKKKIIQALLNRYKKDPANVGKIIKDIYAKLGNNDENIRSYILDQVRAEHKELEVLCRGAHNNTGAGGNIFDGKEIDALIKQNDFVSLKDIYARLGAGDGVIRKKIALAAIKEFDGSNLGNQSLQVIILANYLSEAESQLKEKISAILLDRIRKFSKDEWQYPLEELKGLYKALGEEQIELKEKIIDVLLFNAESKDLNKVTDVLSILGEIYTPKILNDRQENRLIAAVTTVISSTGDISKDKAIHIAGIYIKSSVPRNKDRVQRIVEALIKSKNDYSKKDRISAIEILCEIYAGLGADDKSIRQKIAQYFLSFIKETEMHDHDDISRGLCVIFLNSGPSDIELRKKIVNKLLENIDRSSWYNRNQILNYEILTALMNILPAIRVNEQYLRSMIAKTIIRVSGGFDGHTGFMDEKLALNYRLYYCSSLKLQPTDALKGFIGGIIANLKSSDKRERLAALEVISGVFNEIKPLERTLYELIIKAIFPILNDDDYDVRAGAIRAISRICLDLENDDIGLKGKIIDAIISKLEDHYDDVSRAAAESAINLYKNLQHDESELKRSIIVSLMRNNMNEGAIQRAFAAIAEIYNNLGDSEGEQKSMILDLLISKAKEKNLSPRYYAAYTLGYIKYDANIIDAGISGRIYEALSPLLADVDSRVQDYAATALSQLYKATKDAGVRRRIERIGFDNVNSGQLNIRTIALNRLADIYNFTLPQESNIKERALDVICSAIARERINNPNVIEYTIKQFITDLDRNGFDLLMKRFFKGRSGENMEGISYIIMKLVTVAGSRFKSEAAAAMMDAMNDLRARAVAERLAEMVIGTEVDETAKSEYVSVLWQKMQSTNDGELKKRLYSNLAKRELLTRLDSPEKQLKVITKVLQLFPECDDSEVLKGISDGLSNILKDEGVSIDVKKAIIDLYITFTNNPSSFKFYSKKYPEDDYNGLLLRAQLSTAICENLISCLNALKDADARNKYMNMILDRAEICLKSNDLNLMDIANMLISKAYMVFMFNTVKDKSNISADLYERINKLFSRPKGPSPYIYSDGKIKAKLYFQEYMKETMWVDDYLNASHGYKLKYVLLDKVPDNMSVDDLITKINEENKYAGSALLFEILKNPATLKKLRDYTVQNSGKRVDVEGANAEDLRIIYDLLSIGIIRERIFVKTSDRKVPIVDGKGQKEEVFMSAEVIIPRSPRKYSDFNAHIFNDLTESSDLDYIVYNGHAGMSHTLAASFRDVKAYLKESIIQLSNCWSQSHLSDIQKKFRFAHPILTKTSAWSRDGCMIFGCVMENMLLNGMTTTYDDIRRSIKTNQFAIGGKKVREISPDNYFFVSDEYFTERSDIDGDGIPDVKDDQYTFNVIVHYDDNYDLMFRPATPLQAQIAPEQKGEIAIGDINRYFEDDGLFLSRYRCELDSDTVTSHKGWYSPERDTNEGVAIRKTLTEDSLYLVKLNIGYANSSLASLRAISLYETALYISENKNYEAHSAKESLERDYFNGDIQSEEGRAKAKIVEKKAAEKLGLTVTDINNAYELLGLSNNDEKQHYLINVARAFLIATESMEKFYIQATTSADDKENIKRLFSNFISAYNLPQISFDESLKILDVDESLPIMWYLAYLAKKGIKIPVKFGKRKTERG